MIGSILKSCLQICSVSGLRGNFSIRIWRQYVSLFTSIAAIISLLLTSDRKSSHCLIVGVMKLILGEL